MLRRLRSRRPQRPPRYSVYICAVTSAVLLLLSVSLLYSRLSLSHSYPHRHRHFPRPQNDDVSLSNNPLLSDDDISSTAKSTPADDKIDALDSLDDVVSDDSQKDDDLADDDNDNDSPASDNTRGSGFYFDRVAGAIRRALTRHKIDDWDDEDYTVFNLGLGAADRSRVAFGSDDVPVEMEVRRRMSLVDGIEEALMLKVGARVSPLREGWGDWFDKKSDFLRRDKMFKSNLEVLNPLNNPMLQDPDAVGVTGLTKGDKAVQKWWISYFKKAQKKKESGGEGRKKESDRVVRSLDENVGKVSSLGGNVVKGNGSLDENVGKVLSSGGSGNASIDGNSRNVGNVSGVAMGKTVENFSESNQLGGFKNEVSGLIYADGKRWGYYPGLDPFLSFSDFMDAFFSKGECGVRVFMVWNSPPWMYSVRHQRGLESLLSHHRDACVVVLSETIELDFFRNSFVKDGYKVAVAMPNLDELLKDTPTHIFASAWFEWRKTKYYATHYSELVRLASLYKYGGIYLDSDIIVLQSLSMLSNSVGKEDRLTGETLNGAVMAFKKNSLFVLECLKEFYMTYDDTRLRYNGADLLTRVARRFFSIRTRSVRLLELNVQPSFIFFPIAPQNISRYFTSPTTETEKAEQDKLFRKILNESLTFHFWNSLTSSLIPEPDSLASRLIDHSCIRCSDVL